MCRHYENLVSHSSSLFDRMNPNRPEDSWNICPVAADAIDDYLRTGQAVPLPDDLVTDYVVRADWRPLRFPEIATRLRNSETCSHVVVRGHRSPDSDYAPTHFFVMMNVRGTVYIVDGFLKRLTTDLNQYQVDQQLRHYEVSESFEASVPDITDVGP